MLHTKSRIGLKKHLLLIIVLLFLFMIFIYFYIRTSEYELEYSISDFNIVERYDKNKKAYYFSVIYDNKHYELTSLDKYTNKRKLINNIEVIENEKNTCLKFDTNDISLYSICSNDEGYYVANIDKHDEFSSKDTYENINIDTLDDENYLLWNYHDFIYLNNETQEKIKLFSKDIYNISLVYTFDNYLLIPDYEQNYEFDKMYLINTDRIKIEEIDLRFSVYFDSYFLGNDENKVYLYDLKENQEFYIDINKKEIYKNKNELLINGHWENVSSQTFQKEKPTFTKDEQVSIYLENNSIYMKIPDGTMDLKLTDRNVSELIKVDGLNVYYISEGVLYKYNPYDGEKALLQYSEWNFNTKNMVFIL